MFLVKGAIIELKPPVATTVSFSFSSSWVLSIIESTNPEKPKITPD
jgi:hypothetical protein